MAKNSDVTLTLTGIAGVTPIGVTVSYAAGGVPIATVDLAPAPPGVIKIEGKPTGVLENVDAKKRQNDVTIDISVSAYTGTVSQRKTSKLKFVGMLDGLNIGNVVGGNTYQAVLKNKAQRLLELTVLTPGLVPASINVYKVPMWGMTYDPDQGDNKALRSWASIQGGEEVNFDKSPIETYTEIIKWIIKHQKQGWRKFLSDEKLDNGDYPFAKIFEDPRYVKALAEAETLFNNVDYSAVTTGTIKNSTAIKCLVMEKLGEIFSSGPNIILENYMNFLAHLGCTLIFSNTKMFVVPVNSVINREFKVPNKRQLQDETNAAYPADYNSYSYNDTGYRDLGSVIVTTEGYTGGTYIGYASFERGATVHYTAPKELSNASGVLVVRANPFMMLSATAPLAEEAKNGRQKLDQAKESMMPGIDELQYSKYKGELSSELGESQKKKKDVFTDYLKDTLKNYAETKYFQERFHDRRGSITMDFNPDWVPGTGGSLYIRETEMFIAFYVTEVTHRIDMSPSHSGSAITIVNFSCGRMGEKPVGVDEDMYLGYNLDKEKAVQKAFIADNK